LFIDHYLQTFIQIAVDSLHKHGIVIAAGENMAVDL
jgi:hypothetical protein